MIKSISLKNVALYKNEAKIENLNKINFIYGSNGSGKTTLTNFLKNTEDFEYKECKIIWENSPKEILEYNKKFRDDNFSFSKKIPGIFTIGKENIEIKNEIEELSIKISKKMVSNNLIREICNLIVTDTVFDIDYLINIIKSTLFIKGPFTNLGISDIKSSSYTQLP